MGGNINLGANDITNATSITATNLTGTLQTASQGNVTSVGTLTSLTTSGILTTQNRIVIDNTGSSIYSRFLPSGSTLFFQVGTANTSGSAADLFIGNVLQSASVSSRKFMVKASGNVGIGTEAPAGILDVASTTEGMIIPRMTTTERNALTAVAGMMVYNTTDSKHQGYDGTTWNNFY